MQRRVISAASSSKMKRQLRSPIWNDFARVETEDGEKRAICKHCQKELTGSGNSGTTHLKNHLTRCLASKNKESCKDLENPVVIDGSSVFDEEKSSLDVVRMIIKHGYPLDIIEHEYFSIFVKNLQPRFKLHSRDTLKAGILRVYGDEKEKLQKHFDILSCCFHLILSFLTSHDKKSRYCCFTLQFSEDGLQLKKKILGLKSLENNYTGETLCEMVKDLLLGWKINKKLCSITVQNSSSNEKMVHNLVTWLGHDQDYPPHKLKFFHVPCITHIINLLVQDGLDEIVHILHKIRKAIKCISETANGAQKFQEVDLASQRWDSILFMLQIALNCRETLTLLLSHDCDFPVNISMEEWDSAKAIHECLAVFYDLVHSFLGNKYFITNLYFRNICNIRKNLLRWQKSEQALICLIANKMRERFDSYCIHLIRVSAIAAVFDPWTKLDFVLFSLEHVFDKSTEICSTIRDDIFQIFDGYAEDFSSQLFCSSFIENDRSSSSYGNNDCDVLKKWYESKRDSQRPELHQYLQEPPPPVEELDILGWWHTNGQKFPTLWRIARDILAIPMTTSISNSAFYIEPMTIDSIFNGLDPDIIEASTCGGDWLDNPIMITPNKDKDHSPEPTSCPPSVFVGTSSSLETQKKHALVIADTELMLGNLGSTSCPDTFLDLSNRSLSLEPQPQEKHNSSTANAEPVSDPESISGHESLPTNDIPSNADTRLPLANIGSTSCFEPLPDGTASEVGEFLRRDEAQGLQHNSIRSQEYSWSPPPSSWFKFNVCAAVDNSNTLLAVIVRNDGGNAVDARIYKYDTSVSSLVAEASAFHHAVQLIKQYPVQKAIVEGDASLVVNALKDRKTDAQLEIKDIVREVFTTLDSPPEANVHFSCVNKSCNSLAYDCIKWATKNSFSGILPICWFTGASFTGPRPAIDSMPDNDLSMSL